MSACLFLVLSSLIGQTDKGVDATLRVNAGHVLHRLSPLLYGACIEDVNHEIYGGLYSQMIFGESFQEPSLPNPIPGFRIYGGRWKPKTGELVADPGEGPKLIANEPIIESGEVSIDVLLMGEHAGNAGLILKVGDPQIGADRFTGYEVSLESSGFLVVGRHRQNWEPLRRIPCEAKADRWINLKVRLEANLFEVFVDARSRVIIDDAQLALKPGLMGLRTWQRPARFRNLKVTLKDAPPRSYGFAAGTDELSNNAVRLCLKTRFVRLS
jgi:hypothetical protein